jgi:oligopeptide/dipeptide ABC transporter ATP-binding protein
MTPILEFQGAGKTFELRGKGGGGKLVALADVNLAIEKGQIVGCMGESGCGKSTLARLVVRLEAPTTGHVLFRGDDVHQMKGAELKAYPRNVQLVFQDPYSALAPRMSVRDAIEDPLRIHHIGDASSRKARVAELLDLVGLPAEMANRYPHQLSGGQRQRVNIARALALEPDLLILDEPVSALDVSIQAQVINLLRELHERLGLTYVFISHDLRVVKYLCDVVAVMYLGRIVEYGPTEAVFATPRHPYTAALLQSIPDHRDAAAGVPWAPLRGEVPNPINTPSGCAFHPRCPMAQPICARDRPQLRSISDGRLSACHFAEHVDLKAMLLAAS